MPRYDFKCNECGNVQEVSLKIAEKDTAIVACNACDSEDTEQTFTSVSYEFMTPEGRGRKKAPNDFRNFLSAIKKAHPGSAIRDH